MLNKGPHIHGAMRTLDDILRRMQAHQAKKRPLMRSLKAWDLPPTTAAQGTPEQVVEPGFRSSFDRLTTNGIQALPDFPEPVEKPELVEW